MLITISTAFCFFTTLINAIMKTLKTTVLTVFFSLFYHFSLVAQLSELPSLTWDKISSEDIKMKSLPDDTVSAAAVLCNIGDLSMMDVRNNVGFNLNIHKRIKIFKKEGFSYANVEIPYYSRDDFEFVNFKRAQTITPTGKRVPVESKSVFRQKINDKFSILKFTFPNVTEGCVIEMEYDIESRNVWELHEWYFQEKIPTLESMLKLDVESRFEYTFLFKGEGNLKQTKPVYFSNNDGKTTGVGGRTRVSFYVKNTPAMRPEPYLSTLDNYLTRIRFQLTKYFTNTGATIEHSQNWEKATLDLLDNDYFGKKYLKKSSFDKVWNKVSPLINADDSIVSKAQKLYDWVNINFKFNDRMSIYALLSGDDLLGKGIGNSAELNLLLTGLLRLAGVDANPIILSTRSHERIYKNIPILDQYNHVVIHIDKGNNEFMLLDAGNAMRPMGMVRQEAINGDGWMVKKKGAKWVGIAAKSCEKAVLIKGQLSEAGELKGTIDSQFKGYNALEERSHLTSLESVETQFKTLLNKKTDWKIEAATVENYDKVDLPLKENVSFVIENGAEVNGNLLYFKPNFYTEWETNPFKSATRLFPIEFIYPFNEQFNLSLTIPTGYKVEEMPKPINLSFGKNDIQFIYAISNVENNISVSVKLILKSTLYDTPSYIQLRDFFNKVSAKLQEQIVLKKG